MLTTLFWLAFPSLLLVAWVGLGYAVWGVHRRRQPRVVVLSEADVARLVPRVAQEVLDQLQVEVLLNKTQEEEC